MTRINVKIKAGTESEINATGPAVPPAALDALFERLDALDGADTLVLSGSVPRGVPQDLYQAMVARVAPRDVRVVVDAERELLLCILPYRPFLIKPNLRELCDMVERELTTDAEIAEAAALLRARGAQNVLVSLGAQGALLLDAAGQVHRERAVGGRAVNTVGAGDSMVAGFLCGVEQDSQKALRMGLAAGGATACSAGLATKAEIDALMREF